MRSSEFDEIHSVDCKNGITWVYMNKDKVKDTQFMDWKSLYKIQVEN